MKFKEIWKEFYANKNLFIAVCVILLTISTIGISYSAFFTVKSNTSNQTVTTGTLEVSYTGEDTVLSGDELMPLPDREGLNSASSKIIYVQNTGNLDANFALTIGYDMDKFKTREEAKDTDSLTPIEFIKFAIYDYNSENQESTLIAGPLTIADLPIYSDYTEDNKEEKPSDYRDYQYTILFDKVAKKGSTDSSKTYQVKIWLSDKTTPIASNSFFYVKSQVVAEVAGAKKDYTLKGTLTDNADGALSGATIDIQNGSQVITTETDGAFTIPNLIEGTYNVDITASDKHYKGNLTIKAGDTLAVTSYGATFQGASSQKIFDYAYSYGTTVAQILAANKFANVSHDIVFGTESYNLKPTYLLTSSQSEVANLKLKLDASDGFTLSL